MCAFLLRVTKPGRNSAGSLPSEAASCLDREGMTHALGFTGKATGIVRWSECSLTPEQLVGPLSRGQVVDGSYLVVCIYPDKIRVWSDPLGTVPGYYGLNDSAVVIGTNVLEIASNIGDKIDEDACRLYALFDYVPQPRTLFPHVFRCPPGSVIDIDIRTRQAKTRKYFDLAQAVTDKAVALKRDRRPPDSIIHDTWLTSLRKILGSVHPSSRIGISLSGGLDSRYLMCASKELGYDCWCYTYSSSTSASDTILARRSAECAGMPWQHLPVVYSSSEMASFVAKYGSMEPPAMSFLPQIAERLRSEIDVMLVAAGGDVIWGSHTSLKQIARTFRAYSAWRKYCASRIAAWVGASEIGDISWARSLPTWEATLHDAGKVFDNATREWKFSPVLAERFWSVCYRQPSYTWNSNLVYEDAGITVLCPTLTLDSILTGLALPISASWAGNAYSRSLVRFYPDIADVPLTRTRVSPRAGIVGSELMGLLLPFKRFIGLDWYVPWTRQTDWLPIWNQALSKLGYTSVNEASRRTIPISVEVRLRVAEYLSDLLPKSAKPQDTKSAIGELS